MAITSRITYNDILWVAVGTRRVDGVPGLLAGIVRRMPMTPEDAHVDTLCYENGDHYAAVCTSLRQFDWRVSITAVVDNNDQYGGLADIVERISADCPGQYFEIKYNEEEETWKATIAGATA